MVSQGPLTNRLTSIITVYKLICTKPCSELCCHNSNAQVTMEIPFYCNHGNRISNNRMLCQIRKCGLSCVIRCKRHCSTGQKCNGAQEVVLKAVL